MDSKYTVKSKSGRMVLTSIDLLCRAIHLLERLFRKKKSSPADYKNILICNQAHLGDLVISTAILPLIKERYPNSRIGVLIGSWGVPIFKNHPLIDRIHTLDHWKLNRSPKSTGQKIWIYLVGCKRVFSELKNASYCVAIDLYHFFPNSIPLLWLSRIPSRIGYSSGGFGPLLTEQLLWRDMEQHVCDYHLELLKKIGVLCSDRSELKPSLVVPKTVVLPKIGDLVTKRYCVFHIGAGEASKEGDASKEWSEQNWKCLLNSFDQKNIQVLFTGRGTGQKKTIDRIVQNTKGINLADLLEWEEFVYVISKAEWIVTIDSVAGHVASAFSVPSILIVNGTNRISQWKPLNPLVKILTRQLPCSPCLNRKGCESMACIQTIKPEEVEALMKNG